MKRVKQLLLLITSFVGLGCFPLPAQRGVFTEAEFEAMSVEMAGDMVTTIDADDVQPSHILLDARPDQEYKVSHIEGARQVGYKKFDLAAISELYDVNDTIVVYCSVGYRSGKVAEKLQKAGYRHVYNLKGGLFGWANQSKPLMTDGEVPTDTVHGYNKKWAKWLRKEVPVTY